MWFIHDPPKAAMKKLSHSVYCRARFHSRSVSAELR